ncbi:MAG: hypothetical protein OEV78_13005 [Spirochaetia bacterium]|nr:hypothetical protein [Spirochaetia bacterium]
METLKTIAHRKVVNYRYKSVKPFTEYLVITDKTEIKQKSESVKVIYNYQLYTKKMYANGKINKKNEMILIDQSNGVFENKDIIRMGWIFEEKEIEILA